LWILIVFLQWLHDRLESSLPTGFIVRNHREPHAVAHSPKPAVQLAELNQGQQPLAPKATNPNCTATSCTAFKRLMIVVSAAPIIAGTVPLTFSTGPLGC
jgi:hypothetical protein